MKSEKKDVLVSIRLPTALLEELSLLSRKKHFMTLSETLRSIIREQYLESQNPDKKLKELREGIKEELIEKSMSLGEARLIDELKKIRESLKHEK